MKPERLEMEGFAAYRTKTAVDFAGLDLFALTGPTGAGKSSVIDAITFALYGVVTRYDLKSVAPVVSLGASQARVRLDFSIGPDHYTVARLVKRTTGGGATTAEARLERNGDVVESGAKPVTAAVEKLLGLSVEHFTRSVVLPQGEFAAFLHDKPANQQNLVKALLDMGVLDVVRRLAAERAKVAAAVAEAARSRLDALEPVTGEVVDAAAARVDQLAALEPAVTRGEAAVSAAEVTARTALEATRAVEGRVALAESVAVPADVMALAETLGEATRAEAAAMRAVAEAEETFLATEEAGAGLASTDRLEAINRAIERVSAVRNRLAALELDRLEASVRKAARSYADAEERRLAARSELEKTQASHVAHALAEGLTTGDPCPVCRRPLNEAPSEPPRDLLAARKASEKAEAVAAAASGAVRAAETAHTTALSDKRALTDELASLEAEWPDLPHPAELAAQVAARARAEEQVASARGARAAARSTAEKARARVAQLAERRKAAWEQFDAARDAVAPLGPPPAARQDLAGDWDGLVTWARGEAKRLTEEAMEAAAVAEAAAAAVDTVRGDLEALLASAEVRGQGGASARLASTLASARAHHERLTERAKERVDLEADLMRSTEVATVARSLTTHLQAPNFEGWVLAEALATLVEGANELLDELSGGAYSLALAKGIEVIDHRNADELRPVRSLSGGETFLVSLALALSLGEQIASVSEKGGVALEAIFLDEGFGTLDAETLDTVGSVVSELAAQGRMVGLVTHVKELADQAPACFEVRPGPDGSTIERVGR
ncbi:hypothetical protein BH23ACT5_BH23ACT5_03300 [soil metagenome]